MHPTIYSLIAITLVTVLNTWLWYSMYKKMSRIDQQCNDLTSRCDALCGHVQMLDRSTSDYMRMLVSRIDKDVKFFNPLTTLATKYSIKEQIAENTKKLNELKTKLKEIERELK